MTTREGGNFAAATPSVRPVARPRPSARLIVLLVIALTVMAGCWQVHRLGEGPPEVDRDTRILDVFDPSGLLAARSVGGLELARIRQAELPDPQIVDYGPIGDTHAGERIQVRFNRPMIPLGLAVRPTVDPAVFEIDPPIPGEAYWADPTRLVFSPTESLPPATTFAVTVSPPRAGSDEPAPELRRSWEFTVDRPSLIMAINEPSQRWVDRKRHYHWHTPVVLESRQPIAEAELREHLQALAFDDRGRAESVEVDLRELPSSNRGSTSFEIRPRDHWPGGREIVLVVDAELRGELGPAPIGHDLVFSLFTVDGVVTEDLVCLEGRNVGGCNLGPVGLVLSSPIDARQARHVHVEPRPRGFAAVVTDELDKGGFEHLVLWGDFAFDVDYRVTLDPALRDIYGQPLAGERSFDLRFSPPDPSFDFYAPDQLLNFDAGSSIGVETRYIDELALTLAALEDKEHERLLDYDFGGLYFPADLADTRRERIHPTHSGDYGWSSEPLDLARFSEQKPGVFAFELRPTALSSNAPSDWQPGSRFGLVTLTRLGVTAVGSVSGGFVRVARLQDDSAVAGASVELIDEPGGARRILGETDADGRLALPTSVELSEDSLLRVREGEDRVLVEIGRLAVAGGQRKGSPLKARERVRGTLMTERPLYLPGETIHVIGWAAVSTPYELSGLRPLPERTKVSLRLIDSHGTVLARRSVLAKPHGKFWAKFEVPSDGALGRFRVIADVLGAPLDHEFSVEDVQPPQFQLEATAARTEIGPGEALQVELWTTYLFGGQAPIERAWHDTECEPGRFHPPGLPWNFRVSSQDPLGHGYASGRITGGSGPSGRHSYALEPAPTLAGVARCTHTVSVADASARMTGTSFDFLVHPPLYLAMAVPDHLRGGDDVSVELRALLPDGSPADLERVEVTLRPRRDEVDPRRLQRCRARLRDGRGSCRIRKLETGDYMLEARAELDGLEYVVTRWTDVDYEPPSAADIKEWDVLDVVVSSNGRAVGETVDVRVRAPWSSGRALLIFGKAGVHEVRELELVDGVAVTSFEITDAWIPEVSFKALAIDPRGELPSLQSASTSLSVSSASRWLEVSVSAPTQARTRERIAIDVEVRDAGGAPVTGHVSVWAVDEAMLAYAQIEQPDIVSAFGYDNDFYWKVDVVERYSSVLAPFVPRPDPYAPRRFDPNWREGLIGFGHTGLIGHGSGGGGSGSGTIGLGQAFPLRAKFSNTALFIADAAVDERGHVRVEGQLPDNLTTYRIYALATAPLDSARVEGRAGMAEARVRVTRPLVVRAAVPRALRPGDQAELGILVDNIGGPAGTVEVEVGLADGDDIAKLVGPTKKRMEIARGGQVRVPFELRGEAIGELKIEARAVLFANGRTKPSERDGVEVAIEIQPERTATERVAIYGSSRSSGVALLPLALPEDVDPRYGGLSVSIGASLLSELEDAVTYLSEYPHGCAEQVASRILPLVSFPENYPLRVGDRRAKVAAAIDRLESMAVPSGGFSPWPRYWGPSIPATAYATLVLERARKAGYSVPESLIADARDYLLDQLDVWLSIRGPTLEQDIEAALMLHALAELRDAPATAISTLFERRARLPLFARAQLLLAIAYDDYSERRVERLEALVTELSAYVEETGASARIVSDGPTWTQYWDSDVRTSALVLMALQRGWPGHPLVTKLARGLLDARRGGRWANTQENALALTALAEYAKIHEGDYADYRARIWLDQTLLTQITVEDPTTPFEHGFMPMAALLDAEPSGLIVERSGYGRMYHRVALEWATTAELPARDAGLALTTALRDHAGPLDGSRTIEPSSIIALDLSITTEALVHDVVIEIPLAAGLEAVDSLGRATAKEQLGGDAGGWVSHEELHRDRVLLYADQLPPGEHHRTVYLRAITPGDYQMPAAEAELAYYPEIYGRTSSRRVVIR